MSFIILLSELIFLKDSERFRNYTSQVLFYILLLSLVDTHFASLYLPKMNTMVLFGINKFFSVENGSQLMEIGNFHELPLCRF